MKGALVGGLLGGVLYLILVPIFLYLNLDTETLSSYSLIEFVGQNILRIVIGAIAGSILLPFFYKRYPKYFSNNWIST